jgi:uncharacterized membrane-anchored protein YjiN (DUF445 family)
MGCNSSKLNDGVNASETNYKKTAQDITKKVNNVINRIDAQLAYDDQVQNQLEENATKAVEDVSGAATEAKEEVTKAATDAVEAADAAATEATEAVAEVAADVTADVTAAADATVEAVTDAAADATA